MGYYFLSSPSESSLPKKHSEREPHRRRRKEDDRKRKGKIRPEACDSPSFSDILDSASEDKDLDCRPIKHAGVKKNARRKVGDIYKKHKHNAFYTNKQKPCVKRIKKTTTPRANKAKKPRQKRSMPASISFSDIGSVREFRARREQSTEPYLSSDSALSNESYASVTSEGSSAVSENNNNASVKKRCKKPCVRNRKPRRNAKTVVRRKRRAGKSEELLHRHQRREDDENGDTYERTRENKKKSTHTKKENASRCDANKQTGRYRESRRHSSDRDSASQGTPEIKHNTNMKKMRMSCTSLPNSASTSSSVACESKSYTTVEDDESYQSAVDTRNRKMLKAKRRAKSQKSRAETPSRKPKQKVRRK